MWAIRAQNCFVMLDCVCALANFEKIESWARMRVYEFAKLQNISSKEALAALEAGGFSATNHMMVLEQKALSFLEKKFAKKSGESEKTSVVKEAVVSKSGDSSAKKLASSAKKGALKIEKKESIQKSKNSEVKPEKAALGVEALKAKEVVSKKAASPVKKDKDTVVAKVVSAGEVASSGGSASAVVVAPSYVREPKKDVEVARPHKEVAIVSESASQEKVTVKQEMITPKAAQKNSSAPHFSSNSARPQVNMRPAAKPMGSRPAHQRQIMPSKSAPAAPVEITEIVVSGDMSLQDAAALMGKSSTDLIFALLKQGIVSSKAMLIAPDMISSLAAGFGIAVHREAKKVVEAAKVVRSSSENQSRRAPIVVVIGHVDHGKTTLLDFLRKANVAAREKGGITQHIGAYEVNSSHGKVVFLDTPGHAAFSSMRARGVKMTDLAILVVAADDGIMPQTIEAINQAKAAGVPLIVAINKIDKITTAAPLETVKRQLSQHDLLVEDWGGSVICVPISAKTGQGVSDLLDMIVLQAEMMDLHADSNIPAKAFLLESRLDKGFGAIATVICLEGTLKQGDYFSCGETTGKVRLLLDSSGQRITQTGPSSPVQVVGFDKLPLPADVLTVITADQYNKLKSSKKSDLVPQAHAQRVTAMQDEKSSALKVKLIIKCDNFGSKEAIEGSILTMSKKNKDMEERLQLISTGVGDITESDVDLARNTGASIIGFHIKAEKNAAIYAKENEVEINLYQVIYHLTEALEALVKQPKKAIITISKAGEAIVRKVFPLKDNTVIAGCQVTQGVFGRNGKAVCFRGGAKVGESRIASLQRERKSVKEVHSGFECGFITDDFHDWQVNDVVHFMMETKEIPVD